MTNTEKAAKIIELLKPETVTADEVLPYVEVAECIILNRLYPFKPVEGLSVPERYDYLHCLIVQDLWAKRGAEGQISHQENGINRTWASSHVSPFLMKLIMPMVGSVVDDAQS